MNLCHSDEVEEWSEWSERHGRLGCEGSGETVGRRTSSISNYFGVENRIRTEISRDVSAPLDMTKKP